jgi:putative transcriptional regulator
MTPASSIEPSPGVLLVAEPLLMESNFRRSVILLCEHSDQGSFGLILNKPLPIRLSDITDAIPDLAQTLYLGGPVQQDTLHVVHRCGGRVEGAVEVLENVFWGGDFNKIQDIITSEELDAEDFRLFLGYAGWGAGQLADEIERGGWILVRGTTEIVFEEEPAELWRSVLRQMGGSYSVISNFPEDPRLN